MTGGRPARIAMLLDLRGRGRFALTPSGARWWAFLAQGGTAEEASLKVAQDFRADPDAVRSDMAALAQQLTEQGLLRSPRSKRRWPR
ncbi:PqqD family protein [Streptomyces pathocidini]|uniref:PqqD family protein n=1 Tax=Streptomyces pathocidini TaxID=1650571 RepID=UPI00340D8406